MLYAQLGDPDDLEGLPNWSDVQQQQQSLQIPNAQMIVTKDLPMDGIHFTADSYRVIGQRFADALQDVVAGVSSAEGEDFPQDFPQGESAPAESAQ